MTSRRKLPRSKSFSVVESSLPFIDDVVDSRQFILRLDSRTMAEIRRYVAPPSVVHEVMISALLLLGDPENVTRDWKKCQALIKTAGPSTRGLKSRVGSFDVRELHPEITARAKQILRRHNQGAVRAVSAGISAFYDWVIATISEAESRDEASLTAKPADSRRQVQIFRDQEKKQSQQRRNSFI